MSEWIDVRERLPEPNKRVLACCTDAGIIYISYMRDELEFNEHWTICEDQDCSCTGVTAPIRHWMPLPELPSECKTMFRCKDCYVKKIETGRYCADCLQRHSLIKQRHQTERKIGSSKSRFPEKPND